MPISIARARRHINHYKSALLGRCAHWPSFVFHACPVETAVDVIRAGQLKCRNSIAVARDVANQGALNNNPGTKDWVRFYFRPRTRFHIRTEGVKWRTHPNRLDHHMSVPVMFLFDAEAIFTRDGTAFTEENFAVGGVVPVTDEAGFNRIVFDDVYHDAVPPTPRRGIIWTRRMAEVLVPNALPLDDNLKVILCRTQNEARTLLSLLGGDAAVWRPKIKVQNISEVFFMQWAMYVETISPTPNGLAVKIKPPTDPYLGHPQTIELQIIERPNGQVLWSNPNHPVSALPVEVPLQLQNGTCIEIRIDGALAFQAPINTMISQVVGP